MTDPSGAKAEPAARSLIPLKGMRGSVARNVSAAWQTPRVAMGVDVDMTFCNAFVRDQCIGTDRQTRVTITAPILRAVALCLRQHPRLNALLGSDGIEVVAQINLGLAVALEDGLAVPVIRDADGKSVIALAAEADRLAAGARAGSLPLKTYQGGTFTVTNLGMTGIDWFTPIINTPQVAILGVGRIAEKPVARGGQIAIAPVAVLTLVFDHRAVDGQPAALFLRSLREMLESGAELASSTQ